jgi:hypothetical protein
MAWLRESVHAQLYGRDGSQLFLCLRYSTHLIVNGRIALLRRDKGLASWKRLWGSGLMSKDVVRLRLSKNAARRLFGTRRVAVSKGIEKVLEEYCEKVEKDVLKEFLEERR